MSYYVRVMPECGHDRVLHVETPNRVPPEFIPCEDCGREVYLWAVECREWRAACLKCNYTRWCGQSVETADSVASKHAASKAHTMAIRYTIEPVKFAALRHYYGRRFKFRIDGKPRVPYPKGRSNVGDVPPF